MATATQRRSMGTSASMGSTPTRGMCRVTWGGQRVTEAAGGEEDGGDGGGQLQWHIGEKVGDR